ncbi:sigma 54-interacting transcriptional regulator [Clostridioides difficile]|nr:sigma 54-interacting transcriptional regulator [Clostridioides difficile]
MKKHNILFVSTDDKINIDISKQLENIFGEFCNIDNLVYVNRINIELSSYELVVCSDNDIKEYIHNNIDKNIPIVIVHRTINIENINQIISIENDSDVMVIDAYKESADETAKIIRKLGLIHINLIPYYPGCDKSKCEIGIIAGSRNSIPQNIKQIIDIGDKVIDINTVIEIFTKLNISIDKLHIIKEKYNEDTVSGYRYYTTMNKTMKSFLEIIDEGIASVDKLGKFIYCNKVFSNLVGIDQNEIISNNFMDLFSDKVVKKIFFQEDEVNDEVVNLNNKKLIINKVNVYENNERIKSIISIKNISAIQVLEDKIQNKLQSKGFVSKYTFESVVGESKIIKEKINIARKIATTDFSVLILGENGTGKEIFAQAIHNESLRKNKPFVAVNLSSLSDTLIESELFGYDEGSFTGAIKGGKMGIFERAHTGTIFLDEIGDISLDVQQRLLRVLQEKEVMRMGGSKIIPIDVRIIAATNKDLKKKIKEGSFREDLYYRINVLHIEIPRLRERKEDIPLISKYFLDEINSNKYFTEESMQALTLYEWPGNVRELKNLIYYIDTIVEEDRVDYEHLPEQFRFEKNNTLVNENFDSIILDFKQSNFFEESICILTSIETWNNKNILLGRNKLQEILKEKDIVLSVDQIRKRIDKLKSHGLLLSGVKKQGSFITDEGKNFISYVKIKGVI